MEQKIVDVSEASKAQWMRASELFISLMQKRYESSIRDQRESFEKYFPDDSWEVYEAKIIEAEKHLPVTDIKFPDEDRQAMWAKMFYMRERSKALLLIAEELYSKISDKINGEEFCQGTLVIDPSWWK